VGVIVYEVNLAIDGEIAALKDNAIDLVRFEG